MSDYSGSSDEDEDEVLEQSLLAAENEHLKQERGDLLQKLLALSEMVERAMIGQEKELVETNQALHSEITLQHSMLQDLMSLLPSDEGQDDQAGDSDTGMPMHTLLSEVAEEAELKVLGLLAASQTLAGGRWRRARYNSSLGLPDFFSDDLKLHYLLGDTHLQMRFDAFFPGFSEKVVAEVVWRFFGSQEYSRRIIRSDNLTLDTLDELMLNPRTGARAKVIRFENRLNNTGVQEAIMGCSKRKRTLAKSILAPPNVRRSSKPKRTKTEDSAAPVAASSTLKLRIDDVGDQDVTVVSFASTSLYPTQPRESSLPFDGSIVQGACVWTENGGSRIAVVLSYPNEYRFNGTMRLDENHVAFSPSGNVTMWLARLVEHAASQFVTFIIEETLHRQGRDMRTENATETARVSELSSAASKFLQSLARPSSIASGPSLSSSSS